MVLHVEAQPTFFLKELKQRDRYTGKAVITAGFATEIIMDIFNLVSYSAHKN